MATFRPLLFVREGIVLGVTQDALVDLPLQAASVNQTVTSSCPVGEHHELRDWPHG